MLEIPVKPGWKDGTRITYGGMGDALPGKPPQARAAATRSPWGGRRLGSWYGADMRTHGSDLNKRLFRVLWSLV